MISDLFWELANGLEPKWRTRSGFQIGVRIVVPPFPFDDDATFDSFSKNAAIVFKKPTQDGVHIEDVKEVNGQWLVAGTCPDRRRPRHHHEAGANPGLLPHQKYSDSQYVLPH